LFDRPVVHRHDRCFNLGGYQRALRPTIGLAAAGRVGSAGAAKSFDRKRMSVGKEACFNTGVFTGPSLGESWSGLKKE